MRVGPSSTAPIPTARPVARLPLNMSSIRAIDLSVKPTGRMHALHVGEHRDFSTARPSAKSPDRDRATRHYELASFIERNFLTPDLIRVKLRLSTPEGTCIGEPE